MCNKNEELPTKLVVLPLTKRLGHDRLAVNRRNICTKVSALKPSAKSKCIVRVVVEVNKHIYNFLWEVWFSVSKMAPV